MKAAGILWWRWLTAMVVGKLVGLIVAAAVVGVVVSSFFGIPSVPAAIAIVVVMFFAGLGEGAAVGLAQAIVLRRTIAGVHVWSWTTMTALGAAIAWGLGMGTNVWALEGYGSDLQTFATLVIGGLGLGALVGAAQWTVLRRHAPHAGIWITANALAWVAATLVAWAGATLVGPDQPPQVLGAVAALTGLATGIVVGGITGIALARVVRESFDPAKVAS